jgi:hypothetical protein
VRLPTLPLFGWQGREDFVQIFGIEFSSKHYATTRRTTATRPFFRQFQKSYSRKLAL